MDLHYKSGVVVLANIYLPAIQFGVVELVDGVGSVLLRGEAHRGTPHRAALGILGDLHKLHVPHLLKVVLSQVERGGRGVKAGHGSATTYVCARAISAEMSRFF